jgi:O-antigen/teichoic acid export membrane protein
LAFLGIWVGVLDHRTAEGALQAWCLAQYLSLLPIALWGRTWLAWTFSHRPDVRLMKRMIGFSAVTGVGSIVGILNYRVDQFLVIRLDGKEGAGIYSSAIAVAEGLWLFSSAITLASFARVGRGNPSEAARLTATGIRHTFLVVVCGGISAALLGPILIEVLFGQAYSSAGGPIRILALGTALFAPQGLVNLYYVNHRGRPAFPLFVGSFAIAISVTTGVLLIPIYGTNGAAWATTISYGLASTVSVGLFLRQTQLRHSELWRVRKSDILAYVTLGKEILARLKGRPPAVAVADDPGE